MTPINLTPEKTLLGFLVRHGELNRANIWDSWGNYRLSDEGIQSVEKAAQWLSFNKIGRVISSDVPRAVETAQIIVNACNVACPFDHTDPNLRPWMVAGFTGKTKTPELVEKFKYYLEHPDIPIPDGESLDQLDLRVQVISQYLCSPYDGLPTVLAIHNSVIKAFMGLDDVKEVCDPGGVVCVYMTEKGEFEFDIVLGAIADPTLGVS